MPSDIKNGIGSMDSKSAYMSAQYGVNDRARPLQTQAGDGGYDAPASVTTQAKNARLHAKSEALDMPWISDLNQYVEYGQTAEIHSNPDLVTFHRQFELEASQRAYQEQKESESSARDTPHTTPPADTSPVVTVPAETPPDPATTLMTLRLSLVAVAVLILLLVLFRRRSSP